MVPIFLSGRRVIDHDLFDTNGETKHMPPQGHPRANSASFSVVQFEHHSSRPSSEMTASFARKAVHAGRVHQKPRLGRRLQILLLRNDTCTCAKSKAFEKLDAPLTIVTCQAVLRHSGSVSYNSRLSPVRLFG